MRNDDQQSNNQTFSEMAERQEERFQEIRDESLNVGTGQDAESLRERVERLEKMFEDHQHLEEDGSKELSEETVLRGKSLNISGAGVEKGDFITTPVSVTDGRGDIEERKRATSVGISIAGQKEMADEQINAFISASKVAEEEDLKPRNQVDFDKINYARVRLIHSPQVSAFLSGPSSFAKLSFLSGEATPDIISTGTLTEGGNTLTDSGAVFENDSLIIGQLNILNSAGEFLESRIITSNSSNVITVDEPFTQPTGSYEYQVVMPIFLGTANTPFSRAYISDDIRLGIGTSGGDQVQYIKWGKGSPEGVVTANIGSMFLRRDGGTGSTLYIKESGDGSPSGWVAK